MEDMPTARFMELMDKAEKREITPAEMQELRKISDEWHNEKTAKFQQDNPGWKNVRAMRITRRAPPGGLVKELALGGLEWADNAKAAVLPVANVLEKAIRDGELEIPEHRHASQVASASTKVVEELSTL